MPPCCCCFAAPSVCFNGLQSRRPPPTELGSRELSSILKNASRHSSIEKTLLLYKRAVQGEISIDNYSLPPLLNSCARSLAVKEGREIHGRAIKMNFLQNHAVVGSLIHMYAECSCIEDARLAFDEMHPKNLVIWSILIDGYVKNDFPREALELFGLMVAEDGMPNDVTAIAVLSVCDLKLGKLVHGMMMKLGFNGSVVFITALISMYFRCCDSVSARSAFRNMPERDHVAWNTMVAGLVPNGLFLDGLKCFREAIELDTRLEPLGVINVVKSGVALGDFRAAQIIHGLLEKKGTGIVTTNTWTALIDSYMKFEIACQIFNRMSQKDVMAWTTMISGFADSGFSKDALGFFDNMIKSGVNPNEVTLSSTLSACAYSGSLNHGVWIHQYVKKQKMDGNVILCNALMDMYAKCGNVEVALQLFEGMQTKNVSSWNVIINALARHGDSEKSLELFEKMIACGTRPNSITFVGVLSACSHGALVDLGRYHFETMSTVYGIEPGLEHYACIVDLFGRCGLLQESEELIQKMPLTPDGVVWGALLGACGIHGNIEVAERAAKKLVELEPGTDGVHVLLSNIYAGAYRWEDAKRVRKLMRAQGVHKRPGCSWIEVDGMVHEFLANDNSHAQHQDNCGMLASLLKNMK